MGISPLEKSIESRAFQQYESEVAGFTTEEVSNLVDEKEKAKLNT